MKIGRMPVFVRRLRLGLCSLPVATATLIRDEIRRKDAVPRLSYLHYYHNPLMILARIETMKTPTAVSEYLAAIGRKGGKKSRRSLSPLQARNMVRVREAQKAFRKYYAQCFWYMPAEMKVTLADVPEIVKGLRQNGGRRGYLLAAKLCR